MCCAVGIGQVAHCPIFRHVLGLKGKRDAVFFAFLHFQLTKINAAAIDARRRAGLKAHEMKPHLAQRIRQADRGKHAVRTAVIKHITDDNSALQIRARGDDDRLGVIMRAGSRGHTGDSTVFRCNVYNLRLLEHEVFLLFEHMLHILSVLRTVRLCAQRVHGRALAAVEQTILNARRIRCTSHFAAKRINFTHQMSLCRAANGGITWHIADGIQIDGKNNGFQSQSCARQCRLDARMTGTDDCNVYSSS